MPIINKITNFIVDIFAKNNPTMPDVITIITVIRLLLNVIKLFIYNSFSFSINLLNFFLLPPVVSALILFGRLSYGGINRLRLNFAAAFASDKFKLRFGLRFQVQP